MASKAQPVIPPPPPPPPVHLETIYEESGSSHSSSIVDVHHQSHNRPKASTHSTNQTVQGLISARSIPSVDAHRRQRMYEKIEKPPIEVRYRDGTKGYIHSSLTTTTSTTRNRRNYAHSSRHDSFTTTTTTMNNKSRQIINSTAKKKKKLPKQLDIFLTIITADELNQAGVTPPSTSSPDESEVGTVPKSHPNSSLDTIKTVKDMSLKNTAEVPIQRPPAAVVPPSTHPVQPIVDPSTSNIRFPPAPRHQSQHPPQLRHPQQMPTIRSQSLPPSQTHLPPSTQQKPISNQLPPMAVVPPSQKKVPPSLQITVTSDENENKPPSKSKHSTTKRSSLKCSNETMNSDSNQPFRPSATVLVGGGSRSAFRPFLRPTNLNPQPGIPLNVSLNSQFPTHQFTHKSSQQQQQQQQQIIRPPHSHLPQYRPSSLSKSTHSTLQPSIPTVTNPAIHNRRSMSSDAPRKSVPAATFNQITSDKVISSTSKTKPPNYSQQSVSISSTNSIDYSFDKSHQSRKQNPDSTSHSITVDPTLQWHSVTSKSLFDVPRLSHQFSDIPLRITIPEGTPTHNQKLLSKHDVALEQRLLDAGLSPETIALYERILEVADVQDVDITSPPEIIDQYQHRSLL